MNIIFSQIYMKLLKEDMQVGTFNLYSYVDAHNCKSEK